MAYSINIRRLLDTAQAGPFTRWFFRIVTVVFVLAAFVVLLNDFWRQTASYVLIASVVLELIGIVALAVKILLNIDRQTK